MSKGNEEKKTMDEKAFAILTKESVRLMAESAGFSDLPDDAAAILGEDVSYRLREVTQNSTQYMKHAKRRRLTADDFNNALRQMDVQPVFGFRSQEAMPFKQTRDGELHFVDEVDVNFTNIALNSYTPKNLGETTIKAHWLAVEGQQKHNTSSQGTQVAKSNGKREVSEELLQYYDNMTKAILGFDEEVMKTALVDLRTNPQIVPLLPYFVNFVTNGVKTVSHDINQLTKLLHTVKSLINNPNLYLEPQPYLNLLVQGVMYCVLESLAASINPSNDHWVLRDYAARLLAQIVNSWASPINRLRQNTVKSLKDVLYDLTKPFCSHYGAVMGLLALGCSSVEEILIPHLPVYWPHMSKVMEDMTSMNALVKSDAHKVYGAMLLAAEFVMRKRLTEFEKQNIKTQEPEIVFSVLETEETKESEDVLNSDSLSIPSKFEKPVNELYSELYEYFGDNLAIKLPEMNLKNIVFKPTKKKIEVHLTDPETSKTGEELLADLMEQVRKQEELEKQQRERARIERVKREKERKERLERERIEEEKRAEAQRIMKLETERLRKEKEQQRLIERERIRRNREEEKRRQAILEQQQGERLLEQQMEEDEEEEEESEPSEDLLLLSDTEDVKSERSDNSYHSEVKSEDEEEEEEEASSHPMGLAVKSTVEDPKQGIKLTIAKLPRVKLHIKPVEAPREPKHGKRKRQAQKSPKEMDTFEFTEETEEYKARTSYTTHYYSSEGETSSPSHRKPLTLKLIVKDPKEPISD